MATAKFLHSLRALLKPRDARPAQAESAPRRRPPRARLNLESLEERTLPVITLPSGPVVAAMLDARNYITYEPPSPFNPGVIAATPGLVQSSLQQLATEGWRGLVTYTLDPLQGLGQVPQVAKAVGFTSVVAGIFMGDPQQLAREETVAFTQAPFVDGFLVGNEGLTAGRYTRAQLEAEINRIRTLFGKPVTTSEPLGAYLNDPTLAQVGDWVFPNIHPFNPPDNIRDVTAGAQFTAKQYAAIQAQAPNKAVIIHESWWPTAGDAAATDANQIAYFQLLAAMPNIRFIWGEAYDQFWKMEGNNFAPHFGMNDAGLGVKPIISALQGVYVGRYVYTAWVERLYRDLLGRVGGAGEVLGWVGLIGSMSTPFDQIANSFLGSTEFRQTLITGYYQQFLRHNPDAAGLNFWVGQMAAGMTSEQVLTNILASQEYFQRNGGTFTGYVTGLYVDLLQRQPDATGLSVWVGLLQSGQPRTKVAMGLLDSTEYRQLVFLPSLYQKFLRRPGDPAGISFWLGQLAAGLTWEQVQVSFLTSVEYFVQSQQ